MKLAVFFVLLFLAKISFGQSISVYESFISAGVKITLPSNFDADRSSQNKVEYKAFGSPSWTLGFPLDRINAQMQDQFRGSLFGLEEKTAYELRIVLLDSLPVNSSDTLPIFTFTTLTSPTFEIGSDIKWVSPQGTGSNYTQTNPGNLKVLLSSGLVSCGTTIYCEDGIYTDNRMTFNATTNCSIAEPIQILAAPGASPIFDGAHQSAITWVQSGSDEKLYSASLPEGTDFTNICKINGHLLYPYPTLTSNILTGGYNLTDLSFGADGFVRDGNTIWIKTEAGLNPNVNTVIISRAFRWLTIYGNNNDLHLEIKGITVRNFGKSNIEGTASYTGMAADFRSVNHITLADCDFQSNNADIRFDGSCNFLLIQGCTFENNNGLYSHAMSKKSNTDIPFIATSRARGKETSAIKIFETKGLTLRNNHFLGTNSGIVSAYKTGFVEEVDIYNNIFENNFDAVECDGFWSNLRTWNNEIISPMAAFSIAQPKIGPRYFYRNTVHHLKGRPNVKDDPHFSDCSPTTEYWSAAVAIKTNSGPVAGDSANLYFINNTFHSEDDLGFVFTMWDSEWKNIRFINNILYDENKHFGYFHDLGNHPNYQMNWEHNNFYVHKNDRPLVIAKEMHGQFNCHSIFDIDELEGTLNSISGSTRFSFSNSFSSNPEFMTTANSGFALSNTSEMIDAGMAIPGFYDFYGIKPDLGAKESNSINSIDEVLSHPFEIFPNPSSGSINIVTNRNYQNVRISIYSTNGILLEEFGAMNGNEFKIKASLPSGVYIVQLRSEKDAFAKQLIIF